METREMKLEKLELVIDEQSPMRIKPDSLIFLVKRKTARILRTPDPPTDAVRMTHNATHVPFRDWCSICVASRGRSSPHKRAVLNQWSSDQLHVRPERWLWGLDEGNPATFWSLSFPQSSDHSMWQRDEYHLTCVEKLHANETREQCYDLRQKISHQSNGFVEAVHGHIQGLARCHQTQIETNTGIQLSAISPAIPFAIRYAGFVLSRFTVRPDGRTPFQYLLGTPYVSPLFMIGESVFALIPDHEVRAAKLTNRWISGCWWGRDASSDEHLVGTKHGLLKCRSVRRKLPGEQWSRRETIEARGRSGILTWKRILEYPDQLWNHVETRECRQQRHRWKFLWYLHLHLRLKNSYLKCEFTATVEEAMWRPRRGWWFATHPTWILRNRKWLAESSVTQTFSKHLFQSCWVRTTNWSILARSPLHRSYKYSRITSTQLVKTCHFRGQVHHYCKHRPGDSCNLPGIRVRKCTRWWPQRIHSETYCQVRWRMLGHCSTAVRKSSDDACDGTEKFESVWWDNSVWSRSTLIVQCSCRKTAVHYWSETRFDVRDKMLVIQTLRHQHLQIWHVPRKCWDIWKEHENWISTWRYLHCNQMTWTRPWNTSRDILTLTGPVIQWRGKAHLAHCVTLINFSWRVNVEDRGLLPCPVENQKCMLLVHCQLSWFSHKL